MIEIIQYTSPAKYLEHAGPMLYQDEATNNLIIGLCEGFLKTPPRTPPVMIRVQENGKTVASAFQTPPMNLIVTYASQEAIEKMADYLWEIRASFPGVVGPANESEAFAKIWSKFIGKPLKLGMNQRIYRLDQVVLPHNVSGHMRVAEESELPLVTDWLIKFAQECLPSPERDDVERFKRLAVASIQNQRAHLWIDQGKPVSMAMCNRPTQNGITINGVYTPHNLRKKGYASGVVAHLSQKMLNSGKKFCVLYTDLSNPTSNKIYQNVGYKEVSDSKHFLFV